MSKYNLSESAAEILAKSKVTAGSEKNGVGKKQEPTPGQKQVDLGTAGHKTTDANFDAASEIKQATLPTGKGVAAEPAKTITGQPQQTMGRKDLAGSPEGDETSCSDKVDRKGKKVKQENASKVSVPESQDPDEFEDEDMEEASVEEVMEDLETLSEEDFEEKYGVSKEGAIEHLSEGDDEEEIVQIQDTFKEDIDAMLSGENLSEDFKQKATMIFESAVNARVEAIAEDLEHKFVTQFEESVETIKEDFADKLDSYLDYVVESWMEENEIAIEKGLRSEIVEDFIGALKNVFEEHYIDIPEEKVDVVETLVSKVEELEGSVNEQIEKNIELKKKLFEHEKQDSIDAICEGLTISQAEKIKSLAKSIDFVSEEDFSEKLETIKESYFSNQVKSASIESLNDPVELDEDATTKVVDPLIEQYATKIGKLYKF